MTGTGQKVQPRWRRLKNWGELAHCTRVRIQWPKANALLSSAPANRPLDAHDHLPDWKAAEPETRPELFEWREGVPTEADERCRRMRLDSGAVVDLPGTLAAFEGWLR